jgi:endonuclease/exonuclease/phosphatase family metal-dependent hydrolase
MPVEDYKDLKVLNTHLDAFAQGTDTLEKQVQEIESILENNDKEGHPWVIGGDFNLLPPGRAYDLLGEEEKKSYRKETEIESLFKKYQAVPSLEEVNGADPEKWFTHFPNNPDITKPDRTIDYIFLSSDIKLGKHHIRQDDTLGISDHLPVVVGFELP